METKQTFWQRVVDIWELIVSSARARRGDPEAWESTIRKFEAQDQVSPPHKNSVLFIGSSSINFWATLAQDMAPFPVINRGFGGSYMRDVVKYVDRIVLPYQPRAIVLFVGTNDITKNDPELAQVVFTGFKDFVSRVRAAATDIPIYYIGITPCPSRMKFWPIAQEANHLIKEFSQNEAGVELIDLAPELLGQDGKPSRHLYRFDGIHPNASGYAIWTNVIKTRLEQDLNN